MQDVCWTGNSRSEGGLWETGAAFFFQGKTFSPLTSLRQWVGARLRPCPIAGWLTRWLAGWLRSTRSARCRHSLAARLTSLASHFSPPESSLIPYPYSLISKSVGPARRAGRTSLRSPGVFPALRDARFTNETLDCGHKKPAGRDPRGPAGARLGGRHTRGEGRHSKAFTAESQVESPVANCRYSLGISLQLRSIPTLLPTPFELLRQPLGPAEGKEA